MHTRGTNRIILEKHPKVTSISGTCTTLGLAHLVKSAPEEAVVLTEFLAPFIHSFIHSFIHIEHLYMKTVVYNMVLRRIFEPKKDEVTVEWRRLHDEELHALYYSPNIIREIKSKRLKWAGHVACTGENWIVYRVFVRKHEGRRPLLTLRFRWEDNIKMDLRDVGWGNGLYRSCSVQGQVAGSCECGNEHSKSIKCGEFIELLRTC